MKKIIFTVCLLILVGATVLAVNHNNKRAQFYDEYVVPQNEYLYENSPSAFTDTAFDLSGPWIWIGSIDAADASILPDFPEQFELTFDANGKIESTTDCNSISGSYVRNEEVISVGQFTFTDMACDGETLEAVYANQLMQASSYQIAGDVLSIQLIKDVGVMTFNRK